MTHEITDFKQGIKHVLRTSSVQQLEQFTGKSGFEIAELDTRFSLGQVLSDQMILLVISGDDLRMTIKIHYKPSQAIKVSKHPFDHSTESELNVQLTDYMKELSNQVCGRVCRMFAQHDIHLGMSIPLRLRGFYEVYSDYKEASSPLVKFGDFWEVSNSDGSFFFSSYIEVVNSNTLSDIQFEIAENKQQDDSQGLEFL